MAVWRVRMNAHDRDFSEYCWNNGQVGIWYGAWSADDWVKDSSVQALNAIQKSHGLAWDVTPSFRDTSERFIQKISESDWCLIFLRENNALGLARLEQKVSTSTDPNINLNGELFKFRNIIDKKKFSLGDLPDAFRLIAAQGQSNIFNLRAMAEHADLLASHDSAEAICRYIGQLSMIDMLRLLGAASWETFCMAYLIIERNFVPTGLLAGRTLATLDLAGRDLANGQRIYAQCKKGSNRVCISKEFIQIARDEPSASLYQFVWGGVSEIPEDLRNVTIFTMEDANAWIMTDRGQKYITNFY